MTSDDTTGRPLDLRDLQEADSLGRAWDAWLQDDREPTRHHTSQRLVPGLAATVEDLYGQDDTPGPSAAFRHGLQRDLLHVHAALRSAPVVSAPAIEPISAPPEQGRPARRRPSRPARRWWPALEFATAMILISTLLGVAFGNARIAEFFRDNRPGGFASNGDTTATPVTLEQGWLSEIRDDLGVNERPEHVVATDGFVVVVSSDYQSLSITLTVFDAASGARIWSAGVNDGFVGGVQGTDSAPIVADGKIYFLNRAAWLYVFDISDYPDAAGLLVAKQLPFAATSSSPVLLDGVLYATGGDADETDWFLPDLAERDGTLFIVGDSTDGLIGIDPTTGTFVLQWDSLSVGNDDAGNGLWQIDLAASTATNRLWDPNVLLRYVTALENGLLAVSFTSVEGRPIGVSFRDPADIGTAVHTYQPPEGLWEGAIDVVGDIVVVMADDPENTVALTALDPLRPDTAIRLPWNYRNAPSKPDPTIGGSSTIIVSDDDIIRVYDPLTGTVLGATSIGTSMGEINAIDTDGDTIFVAFEDGTVARFNQIFVEE